MKTKKKIEKFKRRIRLTKISGRKNKRMKTEEKKLKGNEKTKKEWNKNVNKNIRIEEKRKRVT